MPGFGDDFGDPLTPYLGAFGNRQLAGRGRGSPSGLPVQARDASPFALTRERVADELDSDPDLRRKLDQNTTAEVGNDPIKRRWYQALTIDRAVATRKPLGEVVNNPDYYPPETTRQTATTGLGTDPSLWEGANPANYATGNASYDPKKGRYVGFAGGPQTSSYGKTDRGSEYGGIEGGTLPYARAMGYTGPDRTAIGPTGPRGDEDAAVAGLSVADTPRESIYPGQGGRKMPSLLDMFQPTGPGGEAVDLGEALRSRSNSLIGLGMGLMGATRPGLGEALQGFQSGAAADARQQALNEGKTERKQAQSNWERQFARSGESDWAKVARELQLKPGSPEYLAGAKNYYLNKTEGEWDLRDIVDPNDPDQKISVQQHKRTGEIRRPQLPGTALAPADPFTAGAGRPVYGEGPGGFSQPAAAPAAGAAPAARTGAVTMPNGEVLTPPAGLNKDGRKAWTTHIAQTAADVSSGKMTEAQGTSNLFAGKMQIANQMLDPETEKKGLDPLWNRVERYGGWAGNTLALPNDYKAYRDAKDTFLNAFLRRVSGATVHDAEYYREEKVYFPQPGDDATRIEYKRRLRDDAIMRMKQQVGPGYREPPARQSPSAPAGGGGGGGVPAPPPGFNIVQ